MLVIKIIDRTEMKKILVLLFLMFALASSASFADVYVNGYTRQDGTYVQPHYRSNPNSTVEDNYSTYPNVNPYTGEQGRRHIDDSSKNDLDFR